MSLEFSDDTTREELSALMNIEAVSSLSEFVENNRPLLESPDKALSLKGEIALNRYAQTFFMPVIQSLIERIKVLLARTGDDGLSKEERMVYNSYHSQLIELGTKLQDSTNKTARLIKHAVEIEAIKSSRLDSIQLLGVLQQIPELIADTLSAALLTVIDDIQKEVEGHFVSDAHIRELQSRVKYFGRLRDLAVDEVIQSVLEQLNEKLASVRVAGEKSGAGGISIDELNRKEVIDEVNAMMDSVPTQSAE